MLTQFIKLHEEDRGTKLKGPITLRHWGDWQPSAVTSTTPPEHTWHRKGHKLKMDNNRPCEGLALSQGGFHRIRIEPKWLRSFVCTPTCLSKREKPPRSPHDWLCRFCVTSSGNPYRNNGFFRECHRCHLAKGEAFKARSENREPPTKSTKESAKVAALAKELERYRQAEKKSESAQQETASQTSGS